MIVTMAHGSGGRATSELIDEIFINEFDNVILSELEDSAVVEGNGRIAMTTDSFVVDPLKYNGGNIGRLAICGTVNDLLMRGATPKYITCGYIIEEGADTELLREVARSMAETAREAGVIIVAGDTKVIEGNGGMYINTAGVGFVEEGINISSKQCKKGDVIIVSGTLGEHHATILSSRMGIKNNIKSDNAPLTEMVKALLDSERANTRNDVSKNGVDNNSEEFCNATSCKVHTMRDVTRGGLATVLKEVAVNANKTIEIEENSLPTDREVKDFCGLLGLDPLYMGNEGKMIAIVDEDFAEEALNAIRKSKYGENATIIGKVTEDGGGRLILKTPIGGKRELDTLQGEGLPRIC